MKPDFDKLGNDYKSSRTVLIADVDCTAAGESLCQKKGVRGYPTIKVYKKDGSPDGEDYNGARDYAGMKRYVEGNLAGPECSLEDKEGCSKDELQILEESEKMSAADRRSKIQGMEAEVKSKKKQAKELESEVKGLIKSLELWKLGGEKPDKVEQLLSDADFLAGCELRTCIISFLPHILEESAAKRNQHLKNIDAVFKKAKSDGQPVGFMWSQGGDQFEAEEKLALQFGFPAVIAMNLKKERFGVMRGAFNKDGLSQFLSSMMLGKVPLQPMPKGFKWGKADAWDGKDGQLPEEEL